MDLDIRQFLTKAQKQRDSGALQSAYNLMTAAGTSGQTPQCNPELYVLCGEAALQLSCLEIGTACLKLYFEQNPPANQFSCRAYLCQAQLKSPPATGSIEDFQEAVLCFLKAIEISKHESRNHFMVFNASVLYFQAIRPLLRPGWCRHLVSSLRQVVQSLEEVSDQDHIWRAELMMHLIDCLMDSGKTEDAGSFAKVTEEFIKTHTPHLFPKLFTSLVEHKLSERDTLLEMSRNSATLEVIYKIQQFKSVLGKMDEAELAKQDSTKLEEIFHLLVECTKASPMNSLQIRAPIQPADRIAFLLELAVLALQVEHQKVAADCLKELKSVGEASFGQRITLECINCEINLLKKEAKMNDYSKNSVEARLKEIGKLDQLLQTAVREGDPQAVQTVCATQWSFCLPLLQHNLRRRIKAPLFRVAQALEDMQSMLLEMRCQVHSELAVMEEEEGRLEASSTHLQKALLLDNNGTWRESLASALHLVKLRGTLYQTPSRNEDKAAMLMQQARDVQHQHNTDSRPVLVTVGQLLAPTYFQMALDADDPSKISVDGGRSGLVARLSAEAQHHSTFVQKVDGHLEQGPNTDHKERMKLWAMLVKTARKQGVWDVCRAACRFCLRYDDGRWKADKCSRSEEGSRAKYCRGNRCSLSVLRLLAEVCFISAEATIQKLQTQRVELNGTAVPPRDGGVFVSEDDPDWIIYSDWIQALSAYATSKFLRAAELGAEIREPWVVANAAIYLWNYNKHLLAAGEYQRLLPTFQSLVEMLQRTGYSGNRTPFVLLCVAVARGLIQPLCGQDSSELAPPGDKGRKGAQRGTEKASSVPGASYDPASLQDVRKALELCDYALRISNGNIPGERAPIAARKEVLATWVQIKRLLKQQIGSKMDTDEECQNEEVSAMTRVLVGVEMLQCNRNPRHMEFSVPSLTTLVSMASECRWTEAVVELNVWCQLAAFCHHAEEHNLVLYCTKRALQLEEVASKCLTNMPCVLYGLPALNEMLSSAACLRGLSSIQGSMGELRLHQKAMNMLLSSVRFAQKAENPALCVTVARHYWNACLPLTHTAVDRRQLREPLETILQALIHTDNEEDLTLKTAIYSLLLHIHIDRRDWKGALQLLDNAIRAMPLTRHQLPLLEHRVQMKAQLGESVLIDMQRLQLGGEQYCSSMWRRLALCASSRTEQLTYYQKSITSLLSPESLWQKVNLLLEFGMWLYHHNFSKANAQSQVQWATDILLQLETEEAEGSEACKTKKRETTESLIGVPGSSFSQNLSNLREVQQLDSLVQAHILLAVMADRTSPEHQLNLLRAYVFVLQIWQVSMTTVCEISSDVSQSQPTQHLSSAAYKSGKDKSKSRKGMDPPSAEEKHKPIVLDQAFPSTLEDWARYACPDRTRQIFRTNSNPQCINIHSISKQTQSLFHLNLLEKELHSLSLSHLTLPIMHLAETIAHDLLARQALSDLFKLRIVRTCCQLGVETHSPYYGKLPILSGIQEQEQIGAHRVIAIAQERRRLHKSYNQNADMGEKVLPWQQIVGVCSQDIWLGKAEVCLSMGLYQPARQLLAEAHLVATELGDETAVAKSLLSLAILACEEQNHAQALCLLDKAWALGGDEDFWYKLSLTKVRAVVGLRGQDARTQIDQIIKQGSKALRLVLERQINHGPGITFLITSLQLRGAIECIRAMSGHEAGETLSTKDVQKLIAACDTLRQCASDFTKLHYREEAAKSNEECSYGLRVAANNTGDAWEKRRFLLDSLSHMQLAIVDQEHVVMNAQSLLPPQVESSKLSLSAVRRLLRLRLALAELCLAMLEERCEEEKCQALAWKKISVDVALEEFTRGPPEGNSTEEEWLSVGSTLGQVALGQLAAVSSHSLDDTETQARHLSLMGKNLRLLAAQEDPIYLSTLWDRNTQRDAQTNPKAAFIQEENSRTKKDSSRTEPRMTSAKSAELQQRRRKAEQLLSQARTILAKAVSLCLQHQLSASILTDASLNMLECVGQADSELAGQYLALFQSASTVAMMADVLCSVCADSSVSQLSALLSLYRKRLLSQEERPSSMLKKVENPPTNISKSFSQLTISPNHLNILKELPPNLRILLLQHSEHGSELYGAFYKMTKGTLTCSRVAKVPVYPEALLALQEKTRAFGRETKNALLKKSCWHDAEGRVDVLEQNQVFHLKSAAEKKLTNHFREIVQEMDKYLNPLLIQLDFCLRPQSPSVPLSEMADAKEKEERRSSTQTDKMPMEPGEFVVLLADRKLLELPLEALSLVRDEGLTSVSRDFSLQLLHSRLLREKSAKVESYNKKETKGGKGTKDKADQSQSIKGKSTSHILPPHTFPVDTCNFQCNIVNLCNENCFEGINLGERAKILETHTPLLEGLMGSKHTPSVCEIEQMLCRCSGFIYVGTERFMANIAPDKIAALDLSDCHMALLFDLIQNKVPVVQSHLHTPKSPERCVLQKPLDTALLLSLAGVSCVILNQWHSSLQQSTCYMASVLDNLLRVGQTSGQAAQSLRNEDIHIAEAAHDRPTETYGTINGSSVTQKIFTTTQLSPHQPSTILHAPAAQCLYQIHPHFAGQVKRELERLHLRKVAGHFVINPRILRTCASQLSIVLKHLYNPSPSLEGLPVLWEMSCLVAVPKKSTSSDLWDYRPMAPTSHVMKVLERLILDQLRPQVRTLLDPLWFAQTPHLGVEDAASASWWRDTTAPSCGGWVNGSDLLDYLTGRALSGLVVVSDTTPHSK
ncbi:cilia- and flagella-associated protein 46 [Aulostomus maculatus]